MISEKISTKIIKLLQGVVVKCVVAEFLLKKTCVLTKICCVLLAFIFPDLVWRWWHIINKYSMPFFGLISKLFTPDNIIFNSGLSPSKNICFTCLIESPLKMMENAFYFILKALFVLKIFKFLSRLFGLVGKTA